MQNTLKQKYNKYELLAKDNFKLKESTRYYNKCSIKRLKKI